MSAKYIKPGKVKAVAKTAAAKTAVVKTTARKSPAAIDEAGLLDDLRDLILAARQRVATVANATHTMLCWHVGRRLLKENLDEGRAAYGKRILVTVSQQLEAEFGEGFSYSALTRMVRFAESMTDEAIVATLSQQLSWSHFMELLPIKHPLARDFYAGMCRIERWDVRTLRKKIGGMLFQRTALSKNTQAVISSEIAGLNYRRSNCCKPVCIKPLNTPGSTLPGSPERDVHEHTPQNPRRTRCGRAGNRIARLRAARQFDLGGKPRQRARGGTALPREGGTG